MLLAAGLFGLGPAELCALTSALILLCVPILLVAAAVSRTNLYLSKILRLLEQQTQGRRRPPDPDDLPAPGDDDAFTSRPRR
jgi:hypothetical protein